MKDKILLKKKFMTFLFSYLFFCTSGLLMVTLAKFVDNISDLGVATIAKWEVYADTSDNPSDIINLTIGNTTQSYVLKITSTSETKAIYSIVLRNMPAGLEVKLDNDTNFSQPVSGVVSFNNVGFINANDSTTIKTHTLTFRVPIGSNTINAQQITVDVVFNQSNPASN